MNKNIGALLCLLVLLYSCSNQTPKPYGYYRIELPEHEYERLQYPGFSFDISSRATIETVPDASTGKWFNICYPDFNAKIYCSFLPIKPAQLPEVSEDSRKFVYRHVMKADAINQHLYANPQNHVYGILYDLEGNVASPLQLVLTDSVANFFRASLLFNNTPNQDSITPVLSYIREDIEHLMETFRF